MSTFLNKYNIYCDESCHLEKDGIPIMVLGSVWCLAEKTKEISKRIREIKQEHGLPGNFEMKWVKVSSSKVDFYKSIIDFFFDDDDLHFRGVIIPDKSLLRHSDHNQTHDDFYYKMYFDLLKVILNPNARYRIFLDIKDSKSQEKIDKLYEVISNSLLDFDHQIVEFIQNIRSHESELIQLADILTGAIAYKNRNLDSSSAKLSLVDRISKRSGYLLTHTTLLREEKLNLLRWESSLSRKENCI